MSCNGVNPVVARTASLVIVIPPDNVQELSQGSHVISAALAASTSLMRIHYKCAINVGFCTGIELSVVPDLLQRAYGCRI